MARPWVGWTLLVGLWFAHPSSAAAAVTVVPDTFPALLDCGANTLTVETVCPRYETIVVTYARPDGDVLRAGEELRLALGWCYVGGYLADPRYTRSFGWPRPQVRDDAGANLVSVSVKGTNPPAVTILDELPWLRISFDRDLLAREEIRITLGDTSFGGPGQALPAMPGEIDVILLRGTPALGFAPVVDPLPKLRVVGTRVDGLRVLAPATSDGDFDLVVQALEGIEGRFDDRTLVPGYTGTVTFSSTDRRAILPPSFTFTLDDAGVARVPVTLSRGLHTITVEEAGTGRVETSNPVLVRGPVHRAAKPGARVHPRREVYWGVLQQHTAVGGHGMHPPQFAYEYARDVARLDFLAVTEHCATPAYRPEYSDEVARGFDDPGRFVTLDAFEWSSLAQGHRHVLYLDGRGRPNLCDRDEGVNPTVVLTSTLDDLRAALSGIEALVVMHHTAWRQPSTANVLADVDLGDPAWEQQGLFEIFSHHGSSECVDNAPYVIHDDVAEQWPADKPIYFRDALQRGFRVGVVAGSDNHFGMPGSQADAGRLYSRSGLTAVYADDLTREGVWEALKARRTYGTTGARILLEFRLDGHEMGEEYASATRLDGRITVAGTGAIDRVEVFRDGHELVRTFAGEGATGTFRFTEPAVAEGKVHSYYVRVTQADEHLAWSSPIWVRGEAMPALATTLAPVVPNPFNPSTTVRYSLAAEERVTIVVYDLAGRRVRTLVDEHLGAGAHAVEWNGQDEAGQPVASGTYLVRMQAGNVQSTRKVALLR